MNNIIKEFNLPNHTEELKKAEIYIDDLKCRFKFLCNSDLLTDEQYDLFYFETQRVLFYVGKLSESIFNVQENIENKYMMEYKNSPLLGRELFNNEYHELHHPYNTLKNRCFTIMENLEELFMKKNNRKPREIDD